MKGMKVITRFAPSPTGYLHPGHAWSAWFAFEAAHKAGGTFLLRIEDIDPTRCKPEFTQAIFEDLHWLGLTWPEPVRIQSHHMADYQTALDKLTAQGLLYPCFCTRADITAAGHAPHGPEGPLYPGTCRHLGPAERAEKIASGTPYALRLNVAEALRRTGPLTWHDAATGTQPATPEMFGDVVLARKETPTSYHLAVTVDDALQGITLVTRGVDLLTATHIHRLLQALLELPTPHYHHHPLLMDKSGKRFAKRDQSITLRALRAQGKTPQDVLGLYLPQI